MKRAVVDIGTNSTRLLVAEVRDGRIAQELERESTVTRLGAGVDRAGRLGDEGMERVYETLARYHDLIARHDAGEAVAVLTSAVRDAANGEEFATTVRRRFELKPFVLSGDEEARLTFLGAMSERDPQDRTRTLVIDIGGGSTELVTGHGHEMTFHVSTQAGVVRQTERHLDSDPPSEREQAELAADVREIIAQGVPEPIRDGVSHAIAVAGTATSLAAIAQDLEPYDASRVQGYMLDRRRCEEILARVAALPLAERREVKGLHPDRAPTIVAGVIILLEVLDLFGLQKAEVSEHDILRGAALDLAA